MNGKEFSELLKKYNLTHQKAAKLLNCSRSSITKWIRLEEIPQGVEHHLASILYPENMECLVDFLRVTSLDSPNNTELKEFVRKKIEIIYWNNIDLEVKNKYLQLQYPYQETEDFHSDSFVKDVCGVIHFTKETIRRFLEFPGVNVRIFYKIVNDENKRILEQLKDNLFISLLIDNELITITEYTSLLLGVMDEFENLRSHRATAQ
jgi:DNA-binding XRE family transcriptional regulator